MRYYLTTALVLTLGACGSAGEEANGTAENGQAMTANEAPANGTAGAEKLNCAAVKARKAQGLDILGMTIGMPARQAFEATACAMPDSFIESRSFDDGTANFSIKSDTGTILVNLSGALDDQRVVMINRTMKFSAEDRPLRANFVKQMAEKYGPFTSSEADKYYDAHRMVKTVDGKIVDASNPLYENCGQQDADPQCGLYVKYQLQGSGSDGAGHVEFVEFVNMEITDASYSRKQAEALVASVQKENEMQRKQDVTKAIGNKPEL